ncbi:MAG: DUF167 domain-containing protein [Deltaproteobacteria bacterium]|jgi:uncharacterized protein (TIGR00251 family)|nr:DUF167 domain-containing protein [Deltaproteobacteria bacterium]
MAEAPLATRLKVLATPRSSMDRLLGFQADEVKISLAAPPVEGAANEALEKFLARLLGLKTAAVKVLSGQASRHKIVLIEGLAPEETSSRLTALLPKPKVPPKAV